MFILHYQYCFLWFVHSYHSDATNLYQVTVYFFDSMEIEGLLGEIFPARHNGSQTASKYVRV